MSRAVSMCREGLGASPRDWQAPLFFPRHSILKRLVLIQCTTQNFLNVLLLCPSPIAWCLMAFQFSPLGISPSVLSTVAHGGKITLAVTQVASVSRGRGYAGNTTVRGLARSHPAVKFPHRIRSSGTYMGVLLRYHCVELPLVPVQ